MKTIAPVLRAAASAQIDVCASDRDLRNGIPPKIHSTFLNGAGAKVFRAGPLLWVKDSKLVNRSYVVSYNSRELSKA